MSSNDLPFFSFSFSLPLEATLFLISELLLEEGSTDIDGMTIFRFVVDVVEVLGEAIEAVVVVVVSAGALPSMLAVLPSSKTIEAWN